MCIYIYIYIYIHIHTYTYIRITIISVITPSASADVPDADRAINLDGGPISRLIKYNVWFNYWRGR